MKALVVDVNKKSKYFSIIDGGRKYFYYLPNRLATVFIEYLEKGLIIDFEAVDNVKIINNRKAYEVSRIIEIAQVNPHKVFFSHKELQQEMKKVLFSVDYFLVTDFEMSMANYKQKGYSAEIIQAGFVLINKKGETLDEMNNYILPVNPAAINKFTLRFLDLNFDKYLDQAIEYFEFYERLKAVIEKYNPKIVIWGKNDLIVLNESYKLNNMKPITKDKNFIDLLKLHKDYYGIKDDIGLFKTYKTYYKELENQRHDALEDAFVTKEILLAFLKIMEESN